MRLIDLGVVYLLVGVGCALTLSRRRAQGAASSGALDLALTLCVWPLYVPVLLASDRDRAGVRPVSERHTATASQISREHELLVGALGTARANVRSPSLAALLPTTEHLRRLTDHLLRLDAKVRELDEVLASDEFDLHRAERRLRESERATGSGREEAALAIESIRRLQSMRERACRERDELLGLCARLRMQVTVLRFADAEVSGRRDGVPGDAREADIGELVSEILGRIEGVGAALSHEQA